MGMVVKAFSSYRDRYKLQFIKAYNTLVSMYRVFSIEELMNVKFVGIYELVFCKVKWK